MLITESEANKLGLNLTIEDIKAMENAIFSLTNNHFHLPNYSPIITGIQGKRITFDGVNMFNMHDTVEIVGVQYYDGFHYVTSVGTDWIEIDIPFELEGDVTGSLYLIKFPADVRSGVKKVWKHEQATEDTVGVRNESISRWSVTYEKPSTGRSINGLPAYLFDFLKPYEKMRWG